MLENPPSYVAELDHCSLMLTKVVDLTRALLTGGGGAEQMLNLRKAQGILSAMKEDVVEQMELEEMPREKIRCPSGLDGLVMLVPLALDALTGGRGYRSSGGPLLYAWEVGGISRRRNCCRPRLSERCRSGTVLCMKAGPDPA